MVGCLFVVDDNGRSFLMQGMHCSLKNQIRIHITLVVNEVVVQSHRGWRHGEKSGRGRMGEEHYFRGKIMTTKAYIFVNLSPIFSVDS